MEEYSRTIGFPEPNHPPYFYVRLNREWVIFKDNWAILLDSIRGDTRTPLEVTDDIKGEAIASIQLKNTTNEQQNFNFDFKVAGMNRDPMPDGKVDESSAMTIAVPEIGVTVTLIDLRPYPKYEDANMVSINGEYVALFRIEEIK